MEYVIYKKRPKAKNMFSDVFLCILFLWNHFFKYIEKRIVKVITIFI